MTRVGAVFHPDPENQALYQQLYSEVYLKIYPQLESLYKNIRHITGYPR
jgi:sugar (pentulose or hexulose) kinase